MSFGGNEAASYVQLFFKRDELTVTLLADDLPEFARSLVTQEEALMLLEQIKTFNGKASSQWKTRANNHEAAIESGDPFEYVNVLNELSQLESEATLRMRDKQHLNKSMGLLTEELARALEKTQVQAQKLITQAVKASLKVAG